MQVLMDEVETRAHGTEHVTRMVKRIAR